ncbi:Endoribonuclease L-PSP-domain-containing protein [Fusarium tricinctum]|uniref:Endoribonuclease L-PSP-domain-containing protein n=1 Tax=Fusarium tricinctum TaxID=61284 RepID=A0A8K0RM16_9HYPO|nr:Endoribonuclease L-PSP-domain-containing protein [Fusarium tricinctum]
MTEQVWRATRPAAMAGDLNHRFTLLQGRSSSFSTTIPTRTGMESAFSPKGVKPIGPYSQAIKANGLVFVSGQIPAEISGKLIEGTIAEKTHKMCQNARAVLEAAGSSLEKVVKITVFFQNLDDFKEMNNIYAEYFPHKPARSSCEATRLPAGASIEMDIIALQ